MYGIVKKEYHSGGERGRGEVVVILMALHFWKFTYVDQLITDWEGCVYVCVCVCLNACIFVQMYVCMQGRGCCICQLMC